MLNKLPVLLSPPFQFSRCCRFTVLCGLVLVLALSFLPNLNADTISVGTTVDSVWSVYYLGYDGNNRDAYLTMSANANASDVLYQQYLTATQGEVLYYGPDDWPMAGPDGLHSHSGGNPNAYGWLAAAEGYQWIGTSQGAGGSVAGNPVGYYAFAYSFYTPEDVATMKYLVGGVRSDNDLFGIYLNGVLIDGFTDIAFNDTGHDRSFGDVIDRDDFDKSFLEGSFNLRAGQWNTMVFLVGNAPNLGSWDGVHGIFDTSMNPVGFYTNLTFTAEVPEPGTLALIGLSMVGAGFIRRRKK